MDAFKQRNLEDEIEVLNNQLDNLNDKLEIALNALKYISRPWPQKELADTNFNVAKKALLDIKEVK